MEGAVSVDQADFGGLSFYDRHVVAIQKGAAQLPDESLEGVDPPSQNGNLRRLGLVAIGGNRTFGQSVVDVAC